MSVSDSQPVEDDDARYEMTEEERREFIRQWRRDLPELRRQSREAIENLGRIARGRPPLRRGSEAG
jgi:hypothetical protein